MSQVKTIRWKGIQPFGCDTINIIELIHDVSNRMELILQFIRLLLHTNGNYTERNFLSEIFMNLIP